MDKKGQESRKLFIVIALLASSMMITLLESCMSSDKGVAEDKAVAVDEAVANESISQKNHSNEQDVGKFFLRGDVLYWRPYVSGLELNFGKGSIVQTMPPTCYLQESKEFDTDPHFDLIALLASNMHSDKAVANDSISEENYCCEQNTGEFFLRGDVLYWRPYITGLEINFGKGSIVQTMTSTGCLQESKEFDTDPHFDWNAGYRVAVGYKKDNSWGISAEWTQFQGHGHHRSFDNGDLTSHGKVNVKLDQIDLDVGYDYAINCNFNIKPFTGVRGTLIKEGVKGLITTQLTLNDVMDLGEIRHFDYRQNYRAIGVVIGIEGDYNFGRGFGLYGAAAGGLLYGKFKLNFEDRTLIGAFSDTQINTSNRRHLYSFDPNIDLAFGVFWKRNFCKHKQLQMNLGFEVHEYFNQNHLSVYRGDTTFCGGVFSILIAF